MYKNREPEIAIGIVAVGFMVHYPPEAGVSIYGFTLAALLIVIAIRRGAAVLDQRQNPEVGKLKAELSQLKSTVEQLVLRRGK